MALNLDLSVVIVSFNTREILRQCLTTLYNSLTGIPSEVLVVDNASTDGSAEMVLREFPATHLTRFDINLGFAGANNAALRRVSGKYVVLLNSDAFLEPDSLRLALVHMEENPSAGLGGGRLVSPDGDWQPSARMFPSPLNDFLTLSGLAARFPKSRFFGRFDRTWADPFNAAEVDWVPGAFSIIRLSVLNQVGYFDERFFLYYEEVDLCRRMKAAGATIHYWPDIVVVHLGGESSRTLNTSHFSTSGAQLVLWRMRSALLYYRKHHGSMAWLARYVEELWYLLRICKNAPGGPVMQQRVRESEEMINLIEKAWRETAGGDVSPARPW